MDKPSGPVVVTVVDMAVIRGTHNQLDWKRYPESLSDSVHNRKQLFLTSCNHTGPV